MIHGMPIVDIRGNMLAGIDGTLDRSFGSRRLIMFDLLRFGLIDFATERFHTHNGSEFNFEMRQGKCDNSIVVTHRMELAREEWANEAEFNTKVAATAVSLRD